MAQQPCNAVGMSLRVLIILSQQVCTFRLV